MENIALLGEDVVRKDGVGPSIDVSRETGKLLVITLGITRTIEQESLQVTLWGSTDGVNWGLKPLTSFPQKFYCGLYSILLNLNSHPEMCYLRVQWKANRWSKPASDPLFSFYVVAEESGSRVHAASARLQVAVA